MRIQKIKLNNFGSYEGTCSFDINANESDKRIVVVGGKNGAGKTTLFTALQVCLYGFLAFGYKSASRHYFQTVRDLINTNSKLANESNAYVCVNFSHVDENGYNEYIMLRFWEIASGDITERVAIWKNKKQLSDEELDIFQNYLIHLIPPEILRLYFFDGEKIADYFLSEQKINIRDVLMTLSGNDTFDILHDNLKRVISRDKGDDNNSSDTYLSKKDAYEELENYLNFKKTAKNMIAQDIATTESEIQNLNDDYSKKGGITQNEWKELQLQIKDEEFKRERLNYERKTDATDVLPFVIMKDIVSKVLPQIKSEDELQMYKFLSMKVENETFRKSMTDILDGMGLVESLQHEMVIAGIQSYLLEGSDCNLEPILCLSEDEKLAVHNVLARVQNYDVKKFKTYKKALENSIGISKEIREKIQNSTVENFEEYFKKLTELDAELKSLKGQELTISDEILKLQEELNVKLQELKIARKEFEQQLKNDSLLSVTGRALLMVEDLQKDLYDKLIRTVEKQLKFKLGQLIRKDNFFDEIIIDNDFNVHILRRKEIKVADLKKMQKKGGVTNLRNTIGLIAYKTLFGTTSDITVAEFNSIINSIDGDSVELQIELDKNRMSSGEKQIFVMALYWSIMQQSMNDIPFVIDTPFARTDTEHRANITEYFFKELKGQLFILSTNEEISEGHIQAMQSQISNTFMLEYDDDKRTIIHEGKYFEV